MRTLRLRSILTFLTVLVASTAALVNGALANPACGPNSVSCSLSTGTILTNSVESCTDLYSAASYDLVRGIFTMRFQNNTTTPSSQRSAAVSAADEYRVEGVPAGTPLVFSAALDVTLSVYGYDCPPPGRLASSTASATLREGDTNQSSAAITTPVTCSSGGYCCAQAKSLRTALRVIVTRPAGDPFTLHFDFATSGHGSGDGSAQLYFSGLPSGASVVSCQGYRQESPTAVRGMSWGRIKMIYR